MSTQTGLSTHFYGLDCVKYFGESCLGCWVGDLKEASSSSPESLLFLQTGGNVPSASPPTSVLLRVEAEPHFLADRLAPAKRNQTGV